MSNQLLDMPPELIMLILRSLPVNSLLKFSETSKYARFLANSSLHTLQLGIRPILSKQVTTATEYTSDRINVRIKGALNYDYTTLLNFHNALVQSILVRHADTLQTLDLSLWTLTKPIAESIAKLRALRHLTIRLEDNVFVRAVPRRCVAWERRQQDRAWKLLVDTATWKHRLRSLKLVNTEITTDQLTVLLSGTHQCQDLHLKRCRYVDSGLWECLGDTSWLGRTALQRLVLDESGGVLAEGAFKVIGGLKGLRYLNLRGCYGADRTQVANWNETVWRIPEIELPAKECDGDIVLEVDPAYMEGGVRVESA